MESQENEKLTHLTGRVPDSLKDEFWATVPAGVKNQHVMTAAARLWVSLPADLRKQLIDAESSTQKGDRSPFVKAVQAIFRQEVSKSGRQKS